MVDALLSSLLPAFLGGLFLSFCIEQMLRPRPLIVGRPCAAFAVHAGVWTLAFAAELLLMRRPYFAAGNVLALEMLVVVVSNAKQGALREPFVYPDFEYFLDAIKHPRLYLPFIGVWAVVLPLVGYILICVAAFRYEPSLYAAMSVFAYAALLLTMVLCGVAMCWVGRAAVMSFNANADLRRFGLFACLWRYGLAESRIPVLARQSWPVFDNVASKPDLISVQSESFFDPRPYYPTLRPGLLTNFDRLCGESGLHGQLRVPAWGANTVRSEFEFLSGHRGEALGVHRFNPYRRLAASGVQSLALHLKTQGYRTVCIHPYHADFYRRKKVIPALGFDEFLDLERFRAEDRQGPYVGDVALANRALEILRGQDARPIYLHLITMENHGPLHWEEVGPQDHAATSVSPLPARCDDLVAYVRHLRNADAMFGMLAEGLRAHPRPASLCVFGDHVPIMADVYAALGEPAGTTPYLIWGNRDVAEGIPRVAFLHELVDAWLAYCERLGASSPGTASSKRTMSSSSK